LARARTAAWLQAEQRRRVAASRAVSIQRQAARTRLAEQGLYGITVQDALDEDDPVTRLDPTMRPGREEQERRRTG
jgi:hypothetical protein